MFSRLITKYGLATHLALLASLPLALVPFVSESGIVTVIFWVGGISLLWIFAEPSIRSGESSTFARARVRNSILHDPLEWFFVLLLTYAFVRWVNYGVALTYDPGQSQWVVSKPSVEGLPASVKGAGLLPFAVAFGFSVLVTGIRHGMGLAARVWFGITSSLIMGIGGLVAVGMAAAGIDPCAKQLTADLATSSNWGMGFGAWLFIAVSSGVQSEARRWGYARIPFFLAVGGCSAGLVMFSPPVFAAVCFAALLLFAVFNLVWVGRAASKGSVARSFFLMFVGLSLPFFCLMVLFPADVRAAKLQMLDFSVVFSESYWQMRSVLSRIARDMWIKSPWCGVGLGAYGLNVAFFAEKADWLVLPVDPKQTVNGFWMVLSERGILGCVVAVIGLVLMFFAWVQRLVFAFGYLRNNDDADIFVFACPPIVWIAPLTTVLIFTVAAFSPLFSHVPILFAVVTPLALAAASFPKKPAARADSNQKES